MARIAIIVDSFHHFYRPRLKKWASLLQAVVSEEAALSLKILSNGVVVPKSYSVLELFPLIFTEDSYAVNCFKWPFKSFKQIANIKTLSKKRKFFAWKNYFQQLIYHPKLIHLVNPYLYPWYYSYIKMANSKSIVTFHGGDIIIRPYENDQWRETLKILFNDCHYLHFVSDYLRQEAVKLGAPPQKTSVIYPGIDLDFFQPQEFTHDDTEKRPLTLLTVTRLGWEKGLVSALKAVQILLTKGYCFQYWIVGQGTAKDELLFWTKKLGIERQVKIIGQQPPEGVRTLLNSCDIYLQPSIFEALCVSAIEASAMELPVIASNVGGLKEVVDHNITGILVPPDDPQGLVEAIVDLANDREKRIEMGKIGREKVIRQFSLEREVNEWVALYKKALQG
jgi:glycosyltransferase involved in cell wall biosynthesis